MSLINEALKKAQRQRMEDPQAAALPPAPGNPAPAAPANANAPANAPGPRVAKRRPPMAARLQILLIGGGVALFAMGGVLAFLFFWPDEPAPAPAARPVIAASQPPPAPPAPAQPEPKPAVVEPPAPTPTSVAITSPAPAVPPVVVQAPVQSPAQAPAPAAAPPPSPAPVATKTPAPNTPPVPVANPKVYEFLETLRISGIRASATDPKVIMNDRVYRLNDLVDRPTQLRLIRVDGSTLTFVDGTGYEYQKTF